MLAGVAQANDEAAQVAVVTHAGGAHVELYFHALAKSEEVGPVVLSDPDGTFVDKARAILGGKLSKVYTSYPELLTAEKPRMALISMEAKLAPAAINAALDAGCHVLAEKPACTNAEDFAKAAEKADAKKLYLMLALANRVKPEVLEAKRLVAAGEIGKIYGIEMHLVQDQTRLTSPSYHSSWLADKSRAGGGHLTWLGIHWLDLAMFITGSRIEEVAGFAGNVGGQPITIEDSVAMSMRFDNSAFGTLTSGYYLDKGNQSHIKIWGSNGWLQIDSDAPNTVKWYNAKSEKTPPEQVFTGPPDFEPYYAFVRTAVRASMGTGAPPISTSESLHVLKSVFALYRAADTANTQHVK